MEIFYFLFSFQDKIRLLQDDLESERELRQRVSMKKLKIKFNSELLEPTLLCSDRQFL